MRKAKKTENQSKQTKEKAKLKAELKRKEKKIIQLKYIKAKRLSAQMILISKDFKVLSMIWIDISINTKQSLTW